MQHLTQEQLILFHYREVEQSELIAQHLERCPGCRHNYQSLSHTLGSVVLTPVPQRGEGYENDVWRRLAPQLATRQRHRLARWLGAVLARSERPRPREARRLTKSYGTSDFPHPALSHPMGEGARRAGEGAVVGVMFDWRKWCIGAAALLLVSAAFVAGRFWPGRALERQVIRENLAQPRSLANGQRLPFKELSDHLERSQLALIELINSKTNGPVDISIEQVLARELIDVNRIFCRTAAHLDDGVVMSALEDVERTLLEISNSPPRLSSEQFADLRRRLGPDAVLCKIQVVGAHLRARQTADALARHGS